MPSISFSMLTTRSRRRLNSFVVRGKEGLRAIQRLNRGPLADRAGVRRGLRLYLAHGGNDLDRTCRITNAPAGHGIGFGDTVAGQCAIIEARFNLGRGAELEPVIGQVFVHVVGHDPDMRVAHQNVGQRLQLIPAVARTGRVRRAS